LAFDVPFLLDKGHAPIVLANRFLRERAEGNLVQFSSRELSPGTVVEYARDLADLLRTFDDPSPRTLGAEASFFRKQYKKALRASTKSASTVNRRYGTADCFLAYVSAESAERVDLAESLDAYFRRTAPNLSGQRINVLSGHRTVVRRRDPGGLSLLSPQEMLTFFAAFDDRTLAATPKIIYATGARRSEVAGLTVGQILSLRPTSPSAAAKLQVVGKGNKERRLDVEPALNNGLRSYITSDHRLKRAKLWAKKNDTSPFADDAPLLLNRFGDALSGPAITDAFARASDRCRIKRTPHELRHEFAVNFLLDKYRAIAQRIERAGFDAWLARLMVDRASTVLLRLSNLLGHRSVETTRRYLGMLIDLDVEVRDSWCNHLERMGVIENI